MTSPAGLTTSTTPTPAAPPATSTTTTGSVPTSMTQSALAGDL